MEPLPETSPRVLTQVATGTLQKQSKWSDPQRDLRIGDVVLIKDQDLFVKTWPLALVIDIHPGADGRV